MKLCKGCETFIFTRQGLASAAVTEARSEHSAGRMAALKLLEESQITKEEYRALLAKDRFYQKQIRGHAAAEDEIISHTKQEVTKDVSPAKELLDQGKISRGQFLVLKAQNRFYQDHTKRGQGNDLEVKYLKFSLRTDEDVSCTIEKQRIHGYFKDTLQIPLR
jgi:hypothetical protein